MRNKRGNIFINLDWVTVGLILLLMILGWINIYAAVFDETHKSIFDLTQRYGKQLLWILVSIPIAIMLMILDSKFYSVFAYTIFGIGLLLLIAVLLFGVEVNASKSWFEIGSIRIQPAEFMKFMLCLALAQLLSTEGFDIRKFSSLLKIAVLFILPIGLIFLQNDTGTTLVFFALVFVLYREGLNPALFFSCFAFIILFVLSLIVEMHILLIALAGLIMILYYFSGKLNREKKIVVPITTAVILFSILNFNYMFIAVNNETLAFFSIGLIMLVKTIMYIINKSKILLIYMFVLIGVTTYVFSVDYVFDNFLQTHQQNRINEILGKHHDPLGVGYNLNQSKIAIGSGGVSGKGFLQGTQTKYNFVPEQSTDFIFCTIGEEWGFIGSLVVLALFTFLILRILFLAERQRSSFSRIYGYGVASILFFHISVNIGMTIGLAPIIGIPLPFFSYGGSSLWAFTVLIFIFLKLDSDRLEIFR